jgi:hypothetical protein
MISGPYQDPDWVDRPTWTPEALEKAKEAQERLRIRRELEEQMEWVRQQHWFMGYGGTD